MFEKRWLARNSIYLRSSSNVIHLIGGENVLKKLFTSVALVIINEIAKEIIKNSEQSK